jgi:hypothetical protein
MNVMNIKHYLSALAALSMLAACSDYDPGESGNAIDLTEKEEQIIEEYTENFVKRYGAMDPDHTWGFGVKGSEDEMGTRAVQVDRNDWTIYVYEDGTVKLKSTVGTYRKDDWDDNYNYHYMEKAGYVIPGFPSPIDDLYHCDQGVYTQEQIDQMASNMTSEVNQYNLSKAAELSPIGDVTDEEVQYVSWWFRTHPTPKSVTPPFTEFFIQDISQDFDRDSYPSGNQIYTDYSDMDYFSTLTSDGYWEHINNLNQQKANDIINTVPAATLGGDTTALATLTQTYPERTLKYWTSEGPYERGTNDVIIRDGTAYTTSFSYHNSDDNKDYENYVLVHLTFVGPISGKLYDGYYLAFDYEMHKDPGTVNDGEITDIPCDGYYSNWIVKLSPGNPEWKKEDHIWYRVMCEDLGSTDDYDFNDLVFDVYYTGTGSNEDPYLAHIRIQASGGTLPIHIGYNTDAYETHRLLQGDDVEYNASTDLYSPINVGYSSIRGVVTAAPKDIVLNMTELIAGKGLDADQATNPDRIPIYVNKFTSDERKAFVLPETDRTDAAPQKICIPGNSVRWMRERKQIEETYTYFPLWVNQENSPYDFGKAQDWTKNGLQKTGNLY